MATSLNIAHHPSSIKKSSVFIGIPQPLPLVWQIRQLLNAYTCSYVKVSEGWHKCAKRRERVFVVYYLIVRLLLSQAITY